MMSKKESMKRIMDEITEAVKAEAGEGYEVTCAEVEKNNGVIQPVIRIWKHGTSICPSMYIDPFLEKIASGSLSAEKAACEILEAFGHCQGRGGRYKEILEQLDKEEILKRVMCQLIGTKSNGERLKDMPHKEMLDLSVVYRMTLDEDSSERSIIVMTNEICREYGIGLDELDDAARHNTEQSGFSVMNLGAAMAALIGAEQDSSVRGGGSQDMFVLTNEESYCGAAVMLYPQYFDKLATDIDSDLYVLPSSLHEVLAVPAYAVPPEPLREMVANVNRTAVDDQDVLSWNVYRYSRNTKCLTVA